ncbi:hypothetical protein JCM17823_15130 [Halorubrum gandharaense]
MSDDPLPSADPPAGVVVEPATPDDELDVRRILDAAMLELGSVDLGARIAAGTLFVARATREERPDAVAGALVATRPDDDPPRLHIDAVAVRRARRARGIGSALVTAAVRGAAADPETDHVTAEFDADLRGFYEGLGFEIHEEMPDGDGGAADDDRLWGVHSRSADGERRR